LLQPILLHTVQGDCPQQQFFCAWSWRTIHSNIFMQYMVQGDLFAGGPDIVWQIQCFKRRLTIYEKTDHFTQSSIGEAPTGKTDRVNIVQSFTELQYFKPLYYALLLYCILLLSNESIGMLYVILLCANNYIITIIWLTYYFHLRADSYRIATIMSVWFGMKFSDYALATIMVKLRIVRHHSK